MIVRNETLSNLIEEKWEKFIPRLLYLQDDVEPKLLQNLRDYYFNGNMDLSSHANWRILANMFSDRFWNVGFHNAVKTHIQHSTEPTYLYYYTYRSKFTLTDMVVALKGEYHPILEILRMKISNWFKESILGQQLPYHGCSHGDELGMQVFEYH